ncbi:MAG: peptidase, partial [Verrucomicrobia bacterium]|nr:peptidase [Verrucomicrobiota bacterium]
MIPYIADAVPGWFQPVVALYDDSGKEVAFEDDYRFKPDPVMVCQIPKDGEYVLAITDAIYRGREDFVYRITIGETPFVTSIFPLGGRVGEPHTVKMKGLHLDDAQLTPPSKDAAAGIHLIAANKDGFISNPVPFALDTLPETFDSEPNDLPARAQKVTLPIIVNGRIDREDDWDVFQFTGKAGDTVVVEAYARRLDSPVDSVIRLTDAQGQLLAFCDDREDLGAGVNTHHADSYFMAKLPADGAYFVHIGDTGRKGGEEYGYRLRISPPQPDFALRVMATSTSARQKSGGAFTVFAMRKDGFDGPIKISLK